MTIEVRIVVPASWLKWLWPIVILLSTIAVGFVTFTFPHLSVRPIVVMWFLLVCPGMTVVRFFRLTNSVIEWMLAVALSFAIGAGIAGIVLYAGWWSPSRILSVLIGFCLIGVGTQLVVVQYKRPAQARIKAPLIASAKEQEDQALHLTKEDMSEDQDVTLQLPIVTVSENQDAPLQITKEDMSEDQDVTLQLPIVTVPEDQDATLRFAKKDMKNIKAE